MKRGSVWAHMITILFHLIIAALIFYAAATGTDNDVLLYSTGSVLAVTSVLSMVPVLMYM